MSGDYKTGHDDPTSTPFEPARCHGFVTESTFGLPIYRWPASEAIFAHFNTWWRSNAAAGKVTSHTGILSAHRSASSPESMRR